MGSACYFSTTQGGAVAIKLEDTRNAGARQAQTSWSRPTCDFVKPLAPKNRSEMQRCGLWVLQTSKRNRCDSLAVLLLATCVSLRRTLVAFLCRYSTITNNPSSPHLSPHPHLTQTRPLPHTPREEKGSGAEVQTSGPLVGGAGR